MKYPDFICLGTQKSGTSSLYSMLCNHPQIVPNCYKKEVKFWNYSYDKGIDWYKSCFPNIQEKITGDVTSNYFWYVNPETMYKDLPSSVKIIVIFRNPIDRMYSFYNWLKKHPCEFHPIENKSFEESIPCFLEESNYRQYLEKWINIFGKNRILPIIFEEFISKQEEWNKICDYLDVQRNKKENVHVLEQIYEPMNKATRIKLECYFKQKNKLFFDYIERGNVWI